MVRMLKRAAAMVICLSLLMPSFGMLRVYAIDGMCFINYDDKSSDERERYNLGTSHENNLSVNFTEGMPIADFPEDPDRIVNERFNGWYSSTGILVTKDTPITSEMCMMPGFLSISAQWSRDNADITDFKLTNRDVLGNVLNLSFGLSDVDGNRMEFDPAVTEYYAILDANTDSVSMSFNVYEPASAFDVTYMDSAVEREAVIQQEFCSEVGKNVDSSIAVTTSEIKIEPGTDGDIRIPVTAPDGTTKKEYVIHLINTKEKIELGYGNMVYGLIMLDKTLNGDAARQQAKDNFDKNYTYGRTYSPKAWGEGTEIKDGNIPGENEYINYDKDETAMIVYAGSRFRDRGFTLYGTDGTPMTLSDSVKVKRTVYYDKIPSPDFKDWDKAVPSEDVAILSGKENENIISVFEKNCVKPGLAKIVYEYTDTTGHVVSAKRNLIVATQLGDLNADTHINSLDAEWFKRDDIPDESTLSGRILRYRCMDVNMDGAVDNKDTDIMENSRRSVVHIYYDVSDTDQADSKPYATPSVPSDAKAQLYMDYLGKNSNAMIENPSEVPSAPQATETLENGDIFWVGYRLCNADRIFTEGIHSLTFAIDYDTRYLRPAMLLTEGESSSSMSNEQKWVKTMEKYNMASSSSKLTWGSDYSFTGMTASAGSYTSDNSTASTQLESYADIRRIVIDISSDSAGSRVFEDGGDYYIIRIPMEVINVTPVEGRPVMGTSLGADTFNISTGAHGENCIMWNNSSNSLATANLRDYIEYFGDTRFTIPDTTEAIVLPDAVYGEPYLYNSPDTFMNGAIDNADALPPGVSYIRGVNQIEGTPTMAGTYTFYINSIKYSITVNKAMMEVIADDKGKVYGDDNPELTFTYNSACFKNGDTAESDGFTKDLTEPSLSCAGTKNMHYGDTAEIEISGGGSHNYYFTFKNGTLTVDEQKKIDINSVSVIPSCTSLEARMQEFPYTKHAEAALSRSEFTADGILDGDELIITYDVTYSDNTAGENLTVSLSNFAVYTAEGEESNYQIGKTNVTESDKGKIFARQIVSIEIVANPKRLYNYGDTLDLLNGNIGIHYDNGDVATGITFINASGYGLALSYTDDPDHAAPYHGEPVTEEYHKGRGITVSAIDAPGVEPVSMTRKFEINPRPIKVYADDKTRVYGDPNPTLTYHFDESNFVNGDTPETLTNFVEPTLRCSARTDTQVGSNAEIEIFGGSADNYQFEYVKGNLTITQRPINITAITGGIPALTAKVIAANPGASQYEVTSGTATLSQMTVDGIVGTDDIRVNYTAVYNDSKEASGVTVGIKDVRVDESYARGKNYKIGTYPSTAVGGEVLPSAIEDFEITSAPTLNYTYGERLDLSNLTLRVSFDNGDVRSIGCDDFSSYGINVTYGDGGSSAYDKDKLTVGTHNGKTLIVSIPSDLYTIEPKSAGKLSVEKKELHVNAKAMTMAYGDTPEPLYEYTVGDFAYGETGDSTDFTDGLTEPVITSEATNKSDVGEYDITLSGGEAANYKFVYIPSVYTVTARIIDVTAVTGGIPPLTAKQVFEEEGPPYRVAAEVLSDSGNVTISNTANNDVIKLSYDAVYNADEPVDSCTVGIENWTLVSGFGKNHNYAVGASSVSSAEGGRIIEKMPVKLEILSQPELSYIYGDTLNLGGGDVRITYDSGEIISGITFDSLHDYDVELKYTGTDTAASDGDAVSVAYHNGKTITLSVKDNSEVATVKTGEIEVGKKTLKVNVVNSSSIYGEEPEFSFEYDSGDFVNGDTALSDSFTTGLTAPVINCAAAADSNAGDYPVVLTDGAAVNYEFEYHAGIHTIEKRPITITRISGGVPPLTSAIILQQPGEVHELAAKADESQLELGNLISGDKIRVSYTAVYSSIVPTDSTDVAVKDMQMDDGYEKSGNYTINQAPESASGGKILEKQINKVEIVKQPKLNYTYGDTLDLSGGSVKIEYDSGLIEENIPFGELSSHEIAVTYSGTEDAASEGDIVNVPYHNNKKLVLTPDTVYDITPVESDMLIVGKRLLTYGVSSAEAIVYDGETLATEGSIALTGALDGDTVTASGTFTFENALAGENKTVYITDITLDGEWADNYSLEADNTTAVSRINKADIIPVVAADNIKLSDSDNSITVLAPDFTPAQLIGGAKYEYSIDGGETWQENNVFNELAFSQACKVCVRIAETDNYNQSEPTEAVDITTYAARIRVYSPATIDEEPALIVSFYTNHTGVEDVDEFKEFAKIEENYRFFSNSEYTDAIEYPLAFEGDMVFYALNAMSPNGVHAGGGSAVKRPTPTPEPTETPIPTEEPQQNIPYVSGYMGEINPSGNMTRAEVTKIISMISGGYDANADYENIFSDVSDEFWYYNYVGYATLNGWIQGFEGKFHPDDTITRAEFAAIIARYLNLEQADGMRFSDTTSDMWSTGYITVLADKGLVNGDTDGLFRPLSNITRAEGITLVNRMIGRKPHKEIIDSIGCEFTDLDKSHWAYYDIMAAACEYEY